MDLSINQLSDRVEGFVHQRALLEWQRAVGQHPAPFLERLHAAFPELSRPEHLAQVAEVLNSPRTDEQRKGRLALLRRFMLSVTAEARCAGLLDEADLASSTSFDAAARTWTVGEALLRLGHEPSEPMRTATQERLAQVLDADQRPLERRVDALQHLASELQFPSALALVEETQGRPLAPLLEAASALLRDTEDAYLDLLGYALKRVETSLKPGHARLGDLERCALAPWLFELFRREDLNHAVSRCLTDLGLDPAAHGRIAVDVETRPGLLRVNGLFERAVPDDVRLVLTAQTGLAAWAEWLFIWGSAQHRALVSRSLPVVERRLGDRAVVDAMGRLFESFAGEEGFLRRYARQPPAQAKESARLFAFRQLVSLRRSAALLPLSVELLRRGPVRPLATEYGDRLSLALHVEVPRARFLVDVDPLAEHAGALEAWALQAAMHGTLQQKFNEDYWRNPATGRWLEAYASPGQRDDAATVARSLGHESLPLALAGRHRVDVMGA